MKSKDFKNKNIFREVKVWEKKVAARAALQR
jgi:hypothetical protein